MYSTRICWDSWILKKAHWLNKLYHARFELTRFDLVYWHYQWVKMMIIALVAGKSWATLQHTVSRIMWFKVYHTQMSKKSSIIGILGAVILLRHLHMIQVDSLKIKTICHFFPFSRCNSELSVELLTTNRSIIWIKFNVEECYCNNVIEQSKMLQVRKIKRHFLLTIILKFKLTLECFYI